MNKRVIICHGDGDGIISAAVLLNEIGEAEIIITQPFLLDKVVIKDDIEQIYVVDIGVDNKDINKTIEFSRKHLEKIKLWVDHHQGTELLEVVLGSKLIFNQNAPSCPMLLKSCCEVPDEWLDAANASDRPNDFKPTALSERYNKAFKVSLIEVQDGDKNAIDKVQRAFIKELLSGEKSPLITAYGSKYEPILKATKAAADALVELIPGVGITTLTADKIDKTAVSLEGYKKFPVVIVQFTSAENGQPVTMVTTNRKDLNLVEKFNLPSGAPFRVNLPGNFKEIKKLIVEKLS